MVVDLKTQSSRRQRKLLRQEEVYRVRFVGMRARGSQVIRLCLWRRKIRARNLQLCGQTSKSAPLQDCRTAESQGGVLLFQPAERTHGRVRKSRRAPRPRECFAQAPRASLKSNSAAVRHDLRSADCAIGSRSRQKRLPCAESVSTCVLPKVRRQSVGRAVKTRDRVNGRPGST